MHTAVRVARPSLVSRYLMLLSIALAVVAVDQALKGVVTDSLEGRAPLQLLGGTVYLEYTRNTGAAFSMLPNGGWVFVVVATLVSAGILVAYSRLAFHPILFRIGLALILGGAVGNLLDRLRLGYVVDFIDLRWWPVFNAADSAIVIGVLLLGLQSFLDARDQP